MTSSQGAAESERPLDASGVCVVTVTYGDRGDMVRSLANYCRVEPRIREMAIVDNGSTGLAGLESTPDLSIRLVRMGRNRGSAVGYTEGLKAAHAGDQDLFWLLDDDNLPQPGALDLLIERLAHWTEVSGHPLTAVQGFRPAVHDGIWSSILDGGLQRMDGSFRSFHFRQLVAKAAVRLGKRSPTTRSSGPLTAPRDHPVDLELVETCYGGLMARRSLFHVIGFPVAEMVLYEDDSFYTGRIRSSGGTIRLVRGAVIDDGDDYVNRNRNYKNSFDPLLRANSEFRVYYAVRNRRWIEGTLLSSKTLDYQINEFLYCILLFFLSIKYGAYGRYRRVMRALMDGATGVLGESPDHPLP
ncbi:MAG: glycosyltransferase [Sphingobium sp.]